MGIPGSFSDVDKSGLGTTTGITAGDNTCWLAAAANMLVKAGYISTNEDLTKSPTLQKKAETIYSEMISWQGGITNGGWIGYRY